LGKALKINDEAEQTDKTVIVQNKLDLNRAVNDTIL